MVRSCKLRTTGGAGVSLSSNDIDEMANQVNELSDESNGNIAGKSISSSSGRFDNLVGNTLMKFYNSDINLYKTSFSFGNCSPTTFNRTDKAAEYVYGEDVLGEIAWSNSNYRQWMMDGNSRYSSNKNKYFSSDPVSTALYLNIGVSITPQQAQLGALNNGALLNLYNSNGMGHSAFFVGYIYNNQSIIGCHIWDQFGKSSIMFGDKYSFKIKNALNFY